MACGLVHAAELPACICGVGGMMGVPGLCACKHVRADGRGRQVGVYIVVHASCWRKVPAGCMGGVVGAHVMAGHAC